MAASYGGLVRSKSQPLPVAGSPAAPAQVGCLNPSFDVHGRLTFLDWLEAPSRSGEWTVRWRSGHATRLFKLNRAVAFSAIADSCSAAHFGCASA